MENIFISGIAGCGKTVLAKEIILRKLAKDYTIINFDFHGETKDFVKSHNGHNIQMEESEDLSFNHDIKMECNVFKIEYLISFLHSLFKRRFSQQEESFLKEALNEWFEKNKEEDNFPTNIAEVIDMLRKKGSIGASMAYDDYLFHDKKMLTFTFDIDNTSFVNLDFGYEQMLYHRILPHIFFDLLEKIKKSKKQCYIVLEEYHYFTSSFVYRLIKEIVQEKKYDHLHLILICHSFNFKEEYIEVFKSFDQLFYMRQAMVDITRLGEAFHLTEDEKRLLHCLDVGEVLKIDAFGKEFTKIIPTTLGLF